MIEKVRIQGYRIYRDFTFAPNRRLNLVSGANESGKSTLLEAIALALTGRIGGRAAAEQLNPYWFNTVAVDAFVAGLKERPRLPWPEIRIELFLENSDELQHLCGAINTDVPTNACPGVSLRVSPNSDYSAELSEWAKEPSALLPVEYYSMEWRSFADQVLSSRPRALATAIIDSRTVRSSAGVDYHLRHILSDGLAASERATISVAYRKMKAALSEGPLQTVNDKLATTHAALHDQPIVLAMDQSTRASWESAVTPHVDNVPFSMSGQGQQAAIKISLAMSRQSDRAAFVMTEEPENHLTHTSLTTLLSRIRELAGETQQLFVATHSSFVVNRLGLDALHLLGGKNPHRLSDLTPDTVNYFRKLPGHDTLRMVLAKKLVLVEGPSDEILFERVFKDLFSKAPLELGIDVLSVRGLSFARCLELCHNLEKKVAVLRDNDGHLSAELRSPLAKWLHPTERQMFIGSAAGGATLEPQLIHSNSEANLRKVLGLSSGADLLKWMTREKTEAAIRIAGSDRPIVAPTYMAEAAEFIHG